MKLIVRVDVWCWVEMMLEAMFCRSRPQELGRLNQLQQYMRIAKVGVRYTAYWRVMLSRRRERFAEHA